MVFNPEVSGLQTQVIAVIFCLKNYFETWYSILKFQDCKHNNLKAIKP